MGNVCFCANDPILRVLAEFHIVVIREGMPVDRVSKEVQELKTEITCVNQALPQHLQQRFQQFRKLKTREKAFAGKYLLQTQPL